MHLFRCAVAAALFSACFPLHAAGIIAATPLNPGASVVPLMGTYGGSSPTQTSFANSSFSFVETLYADANNPLCPNCLEFVISVQNNNTAASATFVQSVSTEDFTGFQTDVAFSTVSPTAFAPSSASRSEDGSEITFVLAVPPGGSGDALIIYTDATAFGRGNIDVGTSLARIDPPAFAPTAATAPEPSSFLLLTTGLLTVSATLKRRPA